MKARSASALIAHSGLRLAVLGNYKGNEGLRIGDLPEIRIEGGSVDFDQKPTLVIVRQELSKAGHRYFTFLCEEGVDYLKDYLEERVREGEEISTESAVV